MKHFYTAFILLFFIALSSNSEVKKADWLKKAEKFKIEPFMMVQIWGVYSVDMQADLNNDGNLQTVEDRFYTHLRRARLGFRANPYDNLKFTVVAYYDGMGRDALGSSIGPANYPLGEVFGIWDAFASYKALKNTDMINVTAGYFRPQFGRESITSGFATTSGEKAMQQNYIRNHLVNTGPGRAVGINVGGLHINESENFGFRYNVAAFNPTNTSSLQNTGGVNTSLLYVGRVSFDIGDPESKKYSIGYQTNFYNERKGLTLGFSGSHQDATDLFTSSTAISADVLFNWAYFNLDAEVHLMNRQNDNVQSAYEPENTIDYTSTAGHIRASWNFMFGGKIIEPVLMYEFFNGTNDDLEQIDASKVKSYSGTVETTSIGVNYYLNKHNLKILAHYVNDSGTLGRNILSSQGCLGLPIARGNYFLLGVNLVF